MVAVEVVVVGESGIFGASTPLSLETDALRLGSRTSLPTWNMKRRSCHVGEDMMVVVVVVVVWRLFSERQLAELFFAKYV